MIWRSSEPGRTSTFINLNAFKTHVRAGLRPIAIVVGSNMRVPFLGNLIGGFVLIVSAGLVVGGFFPPGTEALLSGLVLIKEAGIHVVRVVATLPRA